MINLDPDDPRTMTDNHLSILSGLSVLAGLYTEHTKMIRSARLASKSRQICQASTHRVDSVRSVSSLHWTRGSVRPVQALCTPITQP